MRNNDLQKYLAGVLAIELNIYTLTGTIKELTIRHNALARQKVLSVPQQKAPATSFFDCFIFSGIASGIISGIIGLFYEGDQAQNILETLAAVIAALFYAVGGLFVGGILFGLLAWVILRKREKEKLDAEFRSNVKKYDADVKKQNMRIATEKAKQAVLAREINALNAKLSESKKALSKAYAFNILAPEYRNIYAVSSLHGYLAKGRTHCLTFNEQTGDQGAYNIYENERRLDRIITNTEEILIRFDHVMQYQQDLAVGLRNASQKIDSLCGDVNSQLNRITGSVSNIERCQNVIAYNSECAARELEFMNWMNLWR